MNRLELAAEHASIADQLTALAAAQRADANEAGIAGNEFDPLDEHLARVSHTMLILPDIASGAFIPASFNPFN